MTWARMPWRVAFNDERCLPSLVRGPVDFLALVRLAARRASEMGRLGLMAFRFSVLGCQRVVERRRRSAVRVDLRICCFGAWGDSLRLEIKNGMRRANGHPCA